MTEAERDTRDLQIHYHLDRMAYWLCAMRAVRKDELYAAMQAHMRGQRNPLSHAIASAFQAITESNKIKPPISMLELFERAECFIENDEDGPQTPVSRQACEAEA